MKALHQAAILVQILLRSHPYQSTTKQPALQNGKIHQYSQSVVNTCGAASRVPVHVKGDGNCLFNAVSVAIYGNEAMVSTDGGLQISTTPTIARKPGQRKRVRTAKIRAIHKRTKLAGPNTERS